MSISTGKSKVILTLAIVDEDPNKEDMVTTVNWPNLDVDHVVFIQHHMLDALKLLGTDSLAILQESKSKNP